MNLIRCGAALAALTLASYASAAPPEAGLGARVAPATGAPSGKAPAKAADLAKGAKGAGVAFGKALSRLDAAPAAATTRGAAETRIYKAASPAVPLIVTKKGLGSGVLISADGKIVTNLHVVGTADEVGVIFKPAIEGQAVSRADVRRAKVLRRDEVADLALIQVEEVPDGVTPLKIGNSTTVQVGADVHAIGHPTGEAWTYTRGVVSQIRRAYGWTAGGPTRHEATVIQTQTPINPGNSGGPLLDDELNVIGINSFVGEGEGMNYAVSAEDVLSFLSRAQDRVAQRVAAKTCEPVTLREEPSKDKKAMHYLMDVDCDGKPDALVTIPKSKREPVTTFSDEDGDGEYDTLFIDDNHDGDPDTALYDTDGNGKPDLQGEFRNGEDEPYKWQKIAEK